jgi:hypothetical protein
VSRLASSEELEEFPPVEAGEAVVVFELSGGTDGHACACPGTCCGEPGCGRCFTECEHGAHLRRAYREHEELEDELERLEDAEPSQEQSDRSNAKGKDTCNR